MLRRIAAASLLCASACTDEAPPLPAESNDTPATPAPEPLRLQVVGASAVSPSITLRCGDDRCGELGTDLVLKLSGLDAGDEVQLDEEKKIADAPSLSFAADEWTLLKRMKLSDLMASKDTPVFDLRIKKKDGREATIKLPVPPKTGERLLALIGRRIETGRITFPDDRPSTTNAILVAETVARILGDARRYGDLDFIALRSDVPCEAKFDVYNRRTRELVASRTWRAAAKPCVESDVAPAKDVDAWLRTIAK